MTVREALVQLVRFAFTGSFEDPPPGQKTLISGRTILIVAAVLFVVVFVVPFLFLATTNN